MQAIKKGAQTRPRGKIFLTFLISAMFLHILDGTAPIDMDVRRFPKARQSRLETLNIGDRINKLLAEIAQRFVRHADLMLFTEIRFDRAAPLCII